MPVKHDFIGIFESFVNKVRLAYDPIVTTNNVTTGGKYPTFYYGHPLDVTNVLSNNQLNSGFGDNTSEYPMICLILDTNLNCGDAMEYDYISTAQILILANTDPVYNSAQRRELVFKPILHPLYGLLMDAIEDSKYVATPPEGTKHVRTDRYYWGKEGIKISGNDGLIFNDQLDGIEINLSGLKVYRINNCLKIQ